MVGVQVRKRTTSPWRMAIRWSPWSFLAILSPFSSVVQKTVDTIFDPTGPTNQETPQRGGFQFLAVAPNWPSENNCLAGEI